MDTKSKKILQAYAKQGARIETKARVKLRNKKDFALWYTPGVGVAATHLAEHPQDARKMSIKRIPSPSSRMAGRTWPWQHRPLWRAAGNGGEGAHI